MPLAGVRVVLDPGHGGQDSGAICGGVAEAAVNYRVAATVAALLRSRGADVSYTVKSAALLPDLREGAPEPPLTLPRDACLCYNRAPVRLRSGAAPDDLYRRAAITRAVRAGLPPEQRTAGRNLFFLSIHCDKLEDPHWHGARVYFDRRDASGPSPFARAIKRRLTAAGLTNSRGGQVIARGYGVLNPHYNVIPQSALVEVATISSPKDRRCAQTPAWRWRVAHILADALQECEEAPSPQNPAL